MRQELPVFIKYITFTVFTQPVIDMVAFRRELEMLKGMAFNIGTGVVNMDCKISTSLKFTENFFMTLRKM